MKKNFMIAVLCCALFSCSKELPTGTNNVKVPAPLPWGASVDSKGAEITDEERQTDCSNSPANAANQYCSNHHIGYPVTGCGNSGSGGGGGSDTGVFCCRLTPPSTPVTPPER
jgi:hypothetical protein